MRATALRTSFGLMLTAALTLSFGACKKKDDAGGAAPTADPIALGGAEQPGGTAGGPQAGAPAIAGSITETMDAGAYTYLKLATSKGEVWAAVRKTKVSVGQQATVTQAMLMSDFESPTLKRKFERIYFGALAGGAASHPSQGGMMGGPMGGMMGKGHGGAPGVPSAGDLQVAHGRVGNAAKLALARPLPKAEGANAYTIAELYAQRAALAGKAVRVRGQVTKFNAEIMARNWVHLQDGSGSTERDDFDLTVTTKDTAQPGQVVLVQGLVQRDRDFGAGYRYTVIVEDATLK